MGVGFAAAGLPAHRVIYRADSYANSNSRINGLKTGFAEPQTYRLWDNSGHRVCMGRGKKIGYIVFYGVPQSKKG